jgi:hypothetical protein
MRLRVSKKERNQAETIQLVARNSFVRKNFLLLTASLHGNADVVHRLRERQPND